MKPLILSLFDEHPMEKMVARELGYEIGKIILRNFPDEETYIKFENNLQDREIIILNSLDRPNQKILPLLFVAETAKQLGAKRVGLCAPYLAYMRQDKRFQSGEGITSEYFAKLLSRYFDWLVTVDPHLHRHYNLSEIYSIPNSVLHAALKISEWIAKNVENPILIGPDSESEQWVKVVAKEASAPYLILEKIRLGDKRVEISSPAIEPFLDHTPILVDDIISTARTMIETIHHLKKLKMKLPICLGVHAVFAEDAYDALVNAGIKKVVTCNTINHPTNQIDLSTIIAKGIQQHVEFHLPPIS